MPKTGQEPSPTKDLVTTYLSDVKSRVDACILDFLPIAHEHPDVHQLYQMMLDYPRRTAKGVTACALPAYMRGVRWKSRTSGEHCRRT